MVHHETGYGTRLRTCRRALSAGRVAASALLIGLFTIGCENVEWNWDTSWWKEPNRTVRPTRPSERQASAAPREDAEQPQRTANPSAAPTENDASPDPGRAGDTEAAKVTQANDVTRKNDLSGLPPDAPTARKPAPPPVNRAFFQLYLVSGPDASAQGRGDLRIVLANVSAELAARVLGSLYVPLGRLGDSDATYLMYEQIEAFESAASLAPFLDVAPMAQPPQDPAGDDLAPGLALYYTILSQRAVVAPALVKACEDRLAATAQSARQPRRTRWAAAILAGRLAAEYRYDYATARSFVRQAERQAEADSIEAMTALWWRADTVRMEKGAHQARGIYATLVEKYAELWPRSYIIQRARAYVREGKG